jgi:hypothetical protein
MKRTLLLGTFVWAPVVLHAQAADPRMPMPERPTVATHAFTVAPGYFELETGVERDANQDHTHSWFAPVYMKVGLTGRMQLGVSTNVVGPASGSTGVGDAMVAVKYRVADDVPLLGAFAVLPALKLPTGDATHGTKTTDGSLLLISSHKFGDASLDINYGYTHRSGNGDHAPINASVWTVSGGVPVTEQIGLAIEVFGYPRTTGPSGAASTTALLGGPTFAVGPYAVIDLGGIARLRGPQANSFYAGLTYNLGHF